MLIIYILIKYLMSLHVIHEDVFIHAICGKITTKMNPIYKSKGNLHV